ncbi:uncharacterized protein LOC121422244 [Lytechinus variegatus]|uniref:uncharacterized protein LOC121422244 n=1 Tax=Lytechinus variegatus TaxID=7654 RepID=UPI001BB2CC41|nr:uncharacterized protein LOC121422244 [Lytechinus variegatus]XP_041473088.1 uncharacterized protein LOC121422244 [Lytechinus variegatus]
MASPSAGLTKEEIKERLAQMKKQYAQMQKKLEKSDKAARVKRHVSKKIADYKRKQSTGGSPECTILRADDVSTVTTGNTRSPSLSKDNKVCLSSELKRSTSRKKSGKRRSVSFVLSPQSTPTSSRHNAVQGTEVASAISGDDRLGVNSQHDCRMSPEPHIQNASRPMKESGDAPNKILFRSGKSQKRKPLVHVVPSGEIGVDQSTDLNEGFVSTDLQNSEQKKDKDITTDKSKTKSDPGDFMKPDKDSPDAKTPPEDTQFDLFADTDEQNEFQHATEVLFHSPVNNDSASYDKMSAACAPMQTVSSCELNTLTTKQTEKEPQPNFVSGCRMKRHEDISQESVIILDETQIDIFQSQTTSRCSQNNEIEILESTGVQEALPRSTSNTYSGAVTLKKSPSMMVSEPGYSLKNPMHVKLNKDKMVSGGHQDMNHSVPDDESAEDPDVIPSTFPEDHEPLTITKNSVSNQNSSTGNSDVMKTNCNQDKMPSPQIDEHKNDFQSSSKHIVDEKGDNSEYEMKGSSQATDVKEVDLAVTKSRLSGNGEIVHNEDAQCVLRNNDVKKDTNHVDPSSVHLDSQNILVSYQELTSQMIDTSPEGKGRTDTQKRTRRRKNQRSIDNLSVDDISLKDFVVSQQNSQEGNHTWIDGLMYPAEYYVRKTRSMSRPSPNLHSAPVLGQKRLSKTSRGRKGSVTRTTPNGVMSEPVHTELPDVGKIQAGKEGSETVSSENLESGNNDACLSVEQSQDFVRGRQMAISESVHDKESHPPRKMKVLRKASTTKRKQGRKTSRKKLESDSECTITQAATTSPTGAHFNSNNGQDEYQNERQDNCDHPEPTTTFDNDHRLPNGEENKTTSSICQLTGGLASQRNYAKDTISVSSGLVCEDSKHFSITQMTNNPLESQFTQTQVPSNFALPKVFGSPGHSTQCPVGLSPVSPSSTPMNALCSPTLMPTASHHGNEMDPIQTGEHTFKQHFEDNPECNDQQWMSEVYLADVVPEVPADIDSEHQGLDSQHDVHAGRLSLDGCDISPSENPDRNEHILPTLQDDPIIDSKVSDILVKNGTRLVGSVIKNEHNLPGGHDQDSEDLFSQLHVPFNDVQDDKCASERTPANDFKDKEPITEHLPSSLPGGPSSLCSNINQGSPMADAATGTPPEVAEMPQAQSQCTDSLKNGSEIDRHSVKETSEDGFIVKECFQFKGCLEPRSEHSLEVQSIVSSVFITDDVSEPLIAAVSPEEITFWILRSDQDGKSFQALCSWSTNESALKVTMCAVLPGMPDVIEALVVVGGQEKTHSVSLIRWDCKKARWNEYPVLSPADGSSCSSLCGLQGEEAAVAIHKEAVGSEVLVIGLDTKNSEKQDFPVMTLPALKERINSLTVVEGADHMLLGMTNSEALLWHVPSRQLVQVFCLKDQKLNYSIEATAESGLLFLVAYSKQLSNCKDHYEEPSCSLLVLNPLNGRSSTLLNYSAPCMQPGVQICDVSMCPDKTIAASLTNGHTCLWDLYSSRLLLEACLDPPQSSTPLCMLDAKTLLLGADGCVSIYERNF